MAGSGREPNSNLQFPAPATAVQWKNAEAAVRAYGLARMAFRSQQEDLKATALLAGNDNKVGVAGEFWAKKIYVAQGWALTEVPESNNEGYDFRCRRGDEELRVSVKVVSDESAKGRQLPLRPSEAWDELCMVLLTAGLALRKFGIVTRDQFVQARQAGSIGSKPVVSRAWLGQKGWITRYGRTQEL